MTLNPTASERTPRAGLAEDQQPDRGGTRLAVRELAQEFEAMFLLQLLRQMRQALLDESSAVEGLGAGTMTDTVDLEVARYLSRATGGIGLADRLLTQRFPLASDPVAGANVDVTTRASAPVSGRPGDDRAALTAPAAPAELAPSRRCLLVEGPVSSAFGWRRDPLAGTPRFHAGIDLQLAYGHEVPAPAAGRVVFAGEQAGYGQTVVVEHVNGYQTRYAHLSAITISAGQDLAAGQVIGRVGQSGRTTGPHLHFEVSRDGRPIDPLELARVMSDRFKSLEGGVDYPLDDTPQRVASTGATHEG